MNISSEMQVNITINIITIAFFAGIWWQSQKNLKEENNSLKKFVTDKFIETRKDVSDKLNDWKEYFKERFKSVETKQDKHNCLIERMVVVEQSVKSSHHRADDLTERVTDLERKVNHE